MPLVPTPYNYRHTILVYDESTFQWSRQTSPILFLCLPSLRLFGTLEVQDIFPLFLSKTSKSRIFLSSFLHPVTYSGCWFPNRQNSRSPRGAIYYIRISSIPLLLIVASQEVKTNRSSTVQTIARRERTIIQEKRGWTENSHKFSSAFSFNSTVMMMLISG